MKTSFLYVKNNLIIEIMIKTVVLNNYNGGSRNNDNEMVGKESNIYNSNYKKDR